MPDLPKLSCHSFMQIKMSRANLSSLTLALEANHCSLRVRFHDTPPDLLFLAKSSPKLSDLGDSIRQVLFHGFNIRLQAELGHGVLMLQLHVPLLEKFVTGEKLLMSCCLGAASPLQCLVLGVHVPKSGLEDAPVGGCRIRGLATAESQSFLTSLEPGSAFSSYLFCFGFHLSSKSLPESFKSFRCLRDRSTLILLSLVHQAVLT